MRKIKLINDKDLYEVKIKIPDYVQKVGRMLIKEGFKAFIAGGPIRDILLEKEPKDYDLATDATPDQMLKIFPKAVSTGKKFGTITILMNDKHGETFNIEATTFRSEENYVDGRWPAEVKFINEISKDLGRRDFTINAMALDLGGEGPEKDSIEHLDDSEKIRSWQIYDPFHGVRDLGIKVVRAVGTPIERFKEDGLRPVRACRFASQLQFDIEKDTFEAIRKAIPVVKLISVERFRDEFMKILYGSPKPSKGINLLYETGILEIFIPELIEARGVEQKLYHATNVWEHLLRSCDIAPDNIKLAALFHDIGKPRKDTKDGHFYGHDQTGSKMTEVIMKRLKFSNKEIKRVKSLVENHMFFYPYETEDMSTEERREIREKQWGDAAIRRFIARVGEENLEDLFSLRVADASANPKTSFKPGEIEALQKRISEVRKKDMALKISDLDITGDDLIEFGVKEGPEVGKILNELLEIVIEDPLMNDKEKLLEEVEKMNL